MAVLNHKSREEAKFLALLARTQEKASRLGVSKRAFHLKNGRKSRPRPEGDRDAGGSSCISDSCSSSQIGSSNEQINRQQSPESEVAVYDWRLPKFVETLEKWLSDLEKHPQGPRKDTLNGYKLKVEFLRKVILTLELEKKEMESAPSRRNSSSSSVDALEARKVGIQSKPDFNRLPHGPATTGEAIAKEIHQKLEGRRDRNLRDQLFGGDDLYGSDFSVNGSRVKADDVEGSGSLDSLVKAHQEAQEKVAEEMLTLTRSLKQQTIVAGEIVRKDTQVIEKSAELAQQNDDKLKIENDRLMERNRSPCRCWIWFILSIVCFTFIAMVWVMKLFRKRRWSDEL